MDTVSAFVGHSFTAEDNNLVSAILTYLDGVASLNKKFTWEHAKQPEPTSIDSKVLGLLEGKNLFIGICTRKERVVDTSLLAPYWYSQRKFKVRESDLVWKTSDWIIQEIGLAIGRNMRIVLLLEDGVRTPGSLQGNLEYIPLAREFPEKSFDKLLGMLATLFCDTNAISPQAAKQEGTSQVEKEVELTKDAIGDSWLTPQLTWKMKDYKFARMHYIAIQDEASEKKVQDQFMASEDGGLDANRKEWAAHGEYVRIAFGKNGDLSRLEKLQSVSPENAEISTYLARAYLKYGEYKQAAIAFNRAAENTNDPARQITLLGEAALCYQKAGNSPIAHQLANLMRERSQETGLGEIQVLNAEKKLAKEQKADEAELAAEERLLEINPTDEDTRFSLAFKYSELGREDLAAYHYSKIPESIRSPMTWNNLGVSLASLGLPIKSVSAYRESERQGETLAMSNLARKLLDAGFVPEAQAILNKAMTVKDHHQNIDKALGTIRDALDSENTKEEALLEKSKPYTDFYKLFGQSLAKPPIASIAGLWKSPKCSLELSVTDTSIVALGNYEIPNKGLGLIDAIRAGGAAPIRRDPVQVGYVIEYRGVIRGRTIVGSVSDRRVEEGSKQTPTLLSIGAEKDVLMWIADSGNEIHVLEHSGNSEPKFYDFHRL